MAPMHGTSANGPSPLNPALGERERKYVFAVALRYVKDSDAAEDIAQDALLLAHRHRHGFRGDCRYSTWLYRVAASAALMYLRKRRRIERDESRDEGDDRAASCLETRDPAPDPAAQCATRETLAAVERRLGELGETYREIFRMRFIEHMTDSEAAAALGVGLSTVKTRTHRTRLALRELPAELRAVA
jgi:RNA polymerase sigma-70 factor, ECF subfamily